MHTLVGKVVSTKGEKSAVVVVESFVTHPKYQKRMMRTKRYLLLDEIGVKEGDMVNFAQIRPMSKTKRWKVVEVVK